MVRFITWQLKNAYMSQRVLLWIIQSSTVIKTNELVVSDRVVFLPCYNTIFVSVILREPLFSIIQSILSVDMLNPQSDLLCGKKKQNRAGRVWPLYTCVYLCFIFKYWQNNRFTCTQQIVSICVNLLQDFHHFFPLSCWTERLYRLCVLEVHQINRAKYERVRSWSNWAEGWKKKSKSI